MGETGYLQRTRQWKVHQESDIMLASPSLRPRVVNEQSSIQAINSNQGNCRDPQKTPRAGGLPGTVQLAGSG